MDKVPVTVADRPYLLVATGQQLAGGRFPYRLLAGAAPPAPRLAVVRRAWQPGVADDGVPVPRWGWWWAGAWYTTAEDLVRAVLAAPKERTR